MHTGYLVPFNVQSQSNVIRCFSDFYDFDNFVSGKRPATERNGPKFGPLWLLLSVRKVHLTVKCSRWSL